MSDHLDRAAEVIAAQMYGLTTPSMCRGIARALEEAGLLVTPERDAAVAAKALREAAEEETAHRIATDLAGSCPACLSLKETK